MLWHRVTKRCEYSLSVRYTHTHTQTHTATHIKRDETRRVESAGSPLRLELFIDRNRNLQTARKLLGNYLFIYCVAVGGKGRGRRGRRRESAWWAVLCYTLARQFVTLLLSPSLSLCAPLSVSISLYRYLHFVNKRGVCAIFALSRPDAAYTQFLRNFYERHLL